MLRIAHAKVAEAWYCQEAILATDCISAEACQACNVYGCCDALRKTWQSKLYFQAIQIVR